MGVPMASVCNVFVVKIHDDTSQPYMCSVLHTSTRARQQYLLASLGKHSEYPSYLLRSGKVSKNQLVMYWQDLPCSETNPPRVSGGRWPTTVMARGVAFFMKVVSIVLYDCLCRERLPALEQQ